MRAQPSHSRRIPLDGRLLSALVLMLACATRGEVEAASLSGAGSFDAASHAKACKCGPKCRGASCCCGSPRSEPSPRPKAAPGRAAGAIVDDNPCLNSAPCHDPILPPSSPIGSPGKVAALGSTELPPIPVGRRLALARSSRLPSDRRSSRLDRPPKA